jgi:hypothetical protein
MKKNLAVVILFCLASMNVVLFAQPNDEKKKEDFEKFKAQRKAYISQIMDLTEAEADVFWPVCDEFQGKRFELNKPLRAEIRKVRQAKKEKKKVSEADYKKIVELSASVKVKEAQLEEEYIKKFLEILPSEKVYSYQQAEQQFAKQVFDRRKDRK